MLVLLLKRRTQITNDKHKINLFLKSKIWKQYCQDIDYLWIYI